MRSRLVITLLVFGAAGGGAAPAAQAYDDSALRSTIARQMRLAGPSSGAYVRDLGSGQELFALREDVLRIPASVEKLYTTSAAILRLGPSATLQTKVVTAGATAVDSEGVLRGDLFLVGGGDPFFGDEEAATLAGEVKSAGIKRIEGALLGDESAFDQRRSGCCRGYDFELGGVLSALAYDRGIFHGRARVDAARFAATRFAAQLRKVGIRTTGPSEAAGAPSGARVIASVRSMPVGQLARFVNVPSNNFAAEMLLKGLGARYGGAGTSSKGAEVVRETLQSTGARPRVADGSGLSRLNRTTPREVVRLLDSMHRRSSASTFRSSLAIPGVTGTVKRRMRGTAASRGCRVKTGTLRNVSALAGYCRAVGGRDIGFALLFNRVIPYGAKVIEDRIATAIARLDAPASAAPTTQPPPAGGENGGTSGQQR